MPAIPAANKGTNSPCGTAASAGPGKYGSLELPNSACALQPGTYVVTGTWGMKNEHEPHRHRRDDLRALRQLGDTRACNANEAGGMLDFKNGNVNLAAPTTGPNQGLAIIYDRNNSRTSASRGTAAPRSRAPST